jgi:hypothetical protein
LASRRDIHQFVRLFDRTGQRFLDEDVNVVSQQLKGDGVVLRRGGGGDDGRVDGSRQSAKVADAGRPELTAGRFARRRDRLDDPYQFDVRPEVEQFAMDATKMAGAHHCDSQSRRFGSSPRACGRRRLTVGFIGG